MKKKSVIFIALIVATVGYFSVLSPLYLKLFLRNDIYSSLEKTLVSTVCIGANCTDEYVFRGLTHPDGDSSVVLGRIWNSFSIRCNDQVVVETEGAGGSVGYRRQKNAFNIFPSEKFEKCTDSFKVLVFYPRSQRKNGFLDSFHSVTSPSFASKLARLNEIISREFQVYVLQLAIIVYFFSLLIRLIAVDEMSKQRVKLAVFLLVGTITQTGLIETFLPFTEIVSINLYLSVISICAYSSLSVAYFLGKSENDRTKTFLRYFSAALFFAIWALTNSIISVWIYFFIFFGVVACICCLKERSVKGLAISFSILVAGLEFYGIKNLPNSYFFPILLAVLLMYENYRALKSYLKINRLLKLSRSRGGSGERKESRFRTNSIIKLFQKQFQVGRVTILNLSDPDVIQIQQYNRMRQQPENWTSKELPPIFAHVITTGNALIDVHADSAIVAALRRGGQRSKTASDQFTVLPIFSGRETIGAIALTDYESTQFSTSLNYSTFLFCLDILKGLLVEHLLTSPKTESLNKIAKLNRQINLHDLTKSDSVASLVDSFGEILNRTFGWRIISATLPNPDYLLSIGKVFSFDPEIEKQVLAGKIYALEENRQGPLALAVHERKPVIVPNTKWLEGVVHANTTKFFNVHGTKTAAFVPVLGPDGFPVAVYWIEGVKDSEITYSDRELFSAFMSTLAERIKLMKADSKVLLSHQSLAQFMPQYLVEDYLAGKEVSEDDHGFLMMFDVKGSTNLSNTISFPEFKSEMDKLKGLIMPKLLERNWVMRQFVWDGFEFTYTSEEEKSEKIDVQELLSLIEPIFDQWKAELIARHGESPQTRDVSFRICFTYGDTSRGIVIEGEIQKWSFNSDAIAVVSKVEQAAKALPGKVFCDSSMLNRCDDGWAKLHTTRHNLDVYGLNVADESKSKLVA
jgi:hypothetical protein